MNQMSKQIRLRDFMVAEDGWGHDEGHDTFRKLLKEVEANPGILIFRISLEGVKRTDASFPRESVVELARRYRGRKGFCLTNFTTQDLIDNWDAAAQKREQPLFVWSDDEYKILGPQPTQGNVEILKYSLSTESVTASSAANTLDIKLTNASTKLKQLSEQGYLLRREELAPSGGVEFKYFRLM